MYCNDPYDLCCRYHGQTVRVQDKSGREHIGRISRVSKDRVWLDSPYGNRGPNNYYGYNNYYGGGFGFSIAIGFIAGIALAALFFI